MELMNRTQPNTLALARGFPIEVSEDGVVLNLPGTEYQLHLLVDAPVDVQLHKSVRGRIVARAKRVDIVRAGGRFIEPVYGRPRRIQGRVVATDPTTNTITVNCGTPMICHLTAEQQPDDFAEGSLVSFDVERGARFEPTLRSSP